MANNHEQHLRLHARNGGRGWRPYRCVLVRQSRQLGRANVFVVDQYNEDGTFDEHKVMLGFNDEAEAQDAYFSNYEKGWAEKRKLVCTPVTIDEFEKWIDSSRRKTKPFAEYKGVNKEASQPIGQADTSDTAASGKENGAAPRQDSLFADTGDNAQAKQKDAAEKIEDYGEQIAGARKDLLKDLAKSMENATLQSLVSLPFSKAFKRPDLKKAFEAGALREKDVRFAEAVIASMLSEKKPKEKRSFRYSARKIKSRAVG